MKSLLAFWTGWSLGFAVLANEPPTRVITLAWGVLSLAMWCYLNKRESGK